MSVVLFSTIVGPSDPRWRAAISRGRREGNALLAQIRGHLSSQRGAVVAREAHNLEVTGSIPVAASNSSDAASPTPSLLRSSESYADAKDGMAGVAQLSQAPEEGARHALTNTQHPAPWTSGVGLHDAPSFLVCDMPHDALRSQNAIGGTRDSFSRGGGDGVTPRALGNEARVSHTLPRDQFQNS